MCNEKRTVIQWELRNGSSNVVTCRTFRLCQILAATLAVCCRERLPLVAPHHLDAVRVLPVGGLRNGGRREIAPGGEQDVRTTLLQSRQQPLVQLFGTAGTVSSCSCVKMPA